MACLDIEFSRREARGDMRLLAHAQAGAGLG